MLFISRTKNLCTLESYLCLAVRETNFLTSFNVSFVDAADVTQCSTRQFTPGVSSLKIKVVCAGKPPGRPCIVMKQGNVSGKPEKVT